MLAYISISKGFKRWKTLVHCKAIEIAGVKCIIHHHIVVKEDFKYIVDKTLYTISDYKTGLRITKQKTKQDAIEEAERLLTTKRVAYKKQVKSFIKEQGVANK